MWGLNDPSKQREVKKLIRDQTADLVYLVETKVRDRNGLQIKEALFPNWGFLNNYDNHELGRIWVCWNTNIFHVLMVLKADQVIHWEVVFLSNSAKWEVPFVYGAYCGFKRQELWQAISGLQWRTRDRSWVVLGDFNVVKDSSERFGGLGHPGFEAEFANWMGVQGLFDHPYIGVLFSWNNKRDATAFLARKLDKALNNSI